MTTPNPGSNQFVQQYTAINQWPSLTLLWFLVSLCCYDPFPTNLVRPGNSKGNASMTHMAWATYVTVCPIMLRPPHFFKTLQ